MFANAAVCVIKCGYVAAVLVSSFVSVIEEFITYSDRGRLLHF